MANPACAQKGMSWTGAGFSKGGVRFHPKAINPAELQTQVPGFWQKDGECKTGQPVRREALLGPGSHPAGLGAASPALVVEHSSLGRNTMGMHSEKLHN